MNLLIILNTFAEGVASGITDSGVAYLGAAIAILTAGFAGIGQGLAAMKAVEAIGRQPEASGKIMGTMVLGQAIVETSGIYALIIAFILTTK
ncbi:ATP synthase F(0) sector subunit c [Alteracholeplasma palmae J233]|uniref:ATP synthase subunit c n=1 Tax=Alteracholeplasma palmae (strain ATCC 49389 / J233) TaxID=1318466 RepID=U4KQM0_ALTPJ|nr:ATP synthase F0 subunit C [Alteracholeplasma palmae]CCV64815.1 ATP synthase F(0) sector subunit c [Alteracholeplasma palmae J233]